MNFKSAVKILLKILFYLIIFVFLVFLLLIFYIFSNYAPDEHLDTNDTNEYELCLKSVKNPEDILHFPKRIPENISETKFYCFSSDYNGEFVFLKFKADKNYINKELKKHKFLNTDENTPIYNMPSETVGIKNTDLIYHIIDNKDNREVYPEYFPYFTGIGTDKNNECIFYYYINPAD